MAEKMISVNCPACGAAANIEEGRTQAFCSYCGSKLILHNDNEHIYRHIDDAEVKQAETEQMVRLKEMELIDKLRADKAKKMPIRIAASVTIGIVGLALIIIGFIGADIYGHDSMIGLLSLVGFPVLFSSPLFVLESKEDKRINKIIEENRKTAEKNIKPSKEALKEDAGNESKRTTISNENMPDQDKINTGDKRKRTTKSNKSISDEDKIKAPSLANYKNNSYGTMEAMFRSAGFTNVTCVPLNDLSVGVFKKPGLVESVSINGRTITSGGRKYSKDAVIVISYHSKRH